MMHAYNNDKIDSLFIAASIQKTTKACLTKPQPNKDLWWLEC